MNAITLPSAQAYNIVDHTYDVVVVGAGGVRPARDTRDGRGRIEDRLHHQGVPDAQSYGCGARRHRRLAGQQRARMIGLAGTCATR